MSTKTKIWLIVAVSLLLIGASLFGGALGMSNYDISKMQSKKYETNKYEFEDAFESISITTNTADIEVLASDDGSCKVVCYEDIKAKHSVKIKDGVLEITVNDQRKWYDHIGFFVFSSQKVTVYIPKGEYDNLTIKSTTNDVTVSENLSFDKADVTCTTGDVKFGASTKTALNIKTGTGDIEIQKSSHGDFNLTVTTGNIKVSHVRCNNATVNVSSGDTRIDGMVCTSFESDGSTGNIVMSDLVSAGNMKVSRGTGDIKLDKCDAANLTLSTVTGNIKGTLLSPKIFIHHSGTGSVNLPQTTTGGTCKITTSTGNINIKID